MNCNEVVTEPFQWTNMIMIGKGTKEERKEKWRKEGRKTRKQGRHEARKAKRKEERFKIMILKYYGWRFCRILQILWIFWHTTGQPPQPWIYPPAILDFSQPPQLRGFSGTPHPPAKAGVLHTMRAQCKKLLTPQFVAILIHHIRAFLVHLS